MKQYKITVNGITYDVQVDEVANAGVAPVAAAAASPAVAPTPAETPAPAQTPAPTATSQGEGNPVTSPMPGTILKVLVSVGQAVKSGETLVILEAMKMENEIKADTDGTITGVNVSVGENVDSGKVLLTIA